MKAQKTSFCLCLALCLNALTVRGDEVADLRISADSKIRLKEFDAAITDLSKIIQLVPDDYWAYFARGTARGEKNDFAGAMSDYTRAIVLKPDSYEAYYGRANAKGRTRDLDGALADFNKAIAFKPDYALAFGGRGNAKAQRGDSAGALADYNKAISLDTNQPSFYVGRAMIKGNRGDLDGAIADYEASIRLNPMDANAFGNMAWAKHVKGNPEEAVKDFTFAISIKPDFTDAFKSRAYSHYNAHMFENALADFRKTAEMIPDPGDYHQFWIWLTQARMGKTEAATKELKDYLKQRKTGKPDDWAAHIGQFLCGDLTEADFLKAADNANKTTDREQHCEAYFYAGSKRLIAGDKTAARDFFQKSVATGQKDFAEHQCAAAELKLLGDVK